jgi:hypothetical protein
MRICASWWLLIAMIPSTLLIVNTVRNFCFHFVDFMLLPSEGFAEVSDATVRPLVAAGRSLWCNCQVHCLLSADWWLLSAVYCLKSEVWCLVSAACCAPLGGCWPLSVVLLPGAMSTVCCLLSNI